MPTGRGPRDLHAHQPPRARRAELVDRAIGDDPPVDDHHDAVAHALHELQLVAGEHDRHAPRRPFAIQHLDQDVGADRVEARERLVEHEEVGLVHEGGGELHPLLVPERQALDPVLRAIGHPEGLEDLQAADPRGRPAHAVEPRQVDELVEDAHLRVEAALLRDVAEPTPSHPVHRPPSPPDLAGIGAEHAEGDPHRRRLAGAVRTDEPDHGSLADIEAHAVERHDVAEPAAQIDQLETRGHRFRIGNGSGGPKHPGVRRVRRPSRPRPSRAEGTRTPLPLRPRAGSR